MVLSGQKGGDLVVTNAVRFAPLLNRYLIQAGPPKSIVIPQASQLVKIQEITVRGRLLKNQVVTWNPRAMKRRITVGKRGGLYALQEDGSLEFGIGVKPLQSHIVCRLQDAAAYLLRFNQSIGHKVSVSGFLRCSFNSPGFDPRENAHIFEIHPVRTVEIDGELHSVELHAPTSSVQDWNPDLSSLDERRKVRYWKGSDMLVFSQLDVEGQQYVRLAGRVSDITLNVSANRPAWFMLENAEIGRQVKVTCLQGTRAVRQLRALDSTEIRVIGLRSIDLAKALEDRYRINLVAIDIQPA